VSDRTGKEQFFSSRRLRNFDDDASQDEDSGKLITTDEGSGMMGVNT